MINEQLQKVYTGTADIVANLNTIDRNALYEITDLPEGGITNAQMTQAITEKFSIFYTYGNTFICLDDGTYSKGHFYTYTQEGWREVEAEHLATKDYVNQAIETAINNLRNELTNNS